MRKIFGILITIVFSVVILIISLTLIELYNNLTSLDLITNANFALLFLTPVGYLGIYLIKHKNDKIYFPQETFEYKIKWKILNSILLKRSFSLINCYFVYVGLLNLILYLTASISISRNELLIVGLIFIPMINYFLTILGLWKFFINKNIKYTYENGIIVINNGNKIMEIKASRVIIPSTINGYLVFGFNRINQLMIMPIKE